MIQTTITQPTPDDASAILEYLHTVAAETDFLSFGKNEFNITLAGEIQFINSMLNTPRNLMLKAVVGEQIVGILTLEAGALPRTHHVSELGISLLKDYWRHGIGTQMMTHAHDFAAKAGTHKICLRVRSHNLPAIKLYEKLGYMREGTFKDDICINHHYYDSYAYGLFL